MEIKEESMGQALIRLCETGRRGKNRGFNCANRKLPPLIRGQIRTLMGSTGSGKSYGAILDLGLGPLRDFIHRYSKYNLAKVLTDDTLRDSLIYKAAAHRGDSLDEVRERLGLLDADEILVEGMLAYRYLQGVHKDKLFYWVIYSFEMSWDEVILRIAAYIFTALTGKLVPSSVIGGYEGELLPEDELVLQEKVAPIMDSYTPYIRIVGKCTVQDIKNNIFNFYLNNGRLEETPEGLKYVTDKELIYHSTYDHIVLVKRTAGSKKEAIDALVDNQVETSTLFGASHDNVQQMNRSVFSVERMRRNPRPTLADAKESGDTLDASHVVIAIFDPDGLGHDEYLGYQIASWGLRTKGRFWFILKGRFRATGVIPMVFYGETGFTQELPPADEMGDLEYNLIREGKWFKHKHK